jgi:hypothetical protein
LFAVVWAVAAEVEAELAVERALAADAAAVFARS